MDRVFLSILNMSLTGSFVIVVILLARFLLNKAPRILSYCLWAAVGFRLIFPFSIESVFSLLPFRGQIIPPGIATQEVPQIDSGLAAVDNIVNNALPTATQSATTPLQMWTTVAACLWLLGVVLMVVRGLLSYVLVKRRIHEPTSRAGSIVETSNIQSPFVFGIFAPKIYLPDGLSGKEREYIILHEQTHIHRRDHIIKFAAYFILCLHWFNPLAWAAYLLMSNDMEMSCDERVLKNLGGGIRKDYSLSLLSLATERRMLSSSLPAFGENGVKKRIKNVLRFRSSSRFVVVLAAVFVVVLSLGLSVSRASVPDSLDSGSAADNTYVISDYYTAEGRFSELGLTLEEIDAERILVLNSGDLLIVGDHQYQVTEGTLRLSAATQTSRDKAILWWTDYLNSLAEAGKVQRL